MRTSDFLYDLPEELIAQDPLPDRSASRLLCLDRQSGRIAHTDFPHILDVIRPGDCLVINDTKVIPARLLGYRAGTGGAAELLLLRRLGDDLWESLARPGKKCRPGTELVFGNGELRATVEDVLPDGNRLVRFSYDGIFEEVLDALGEMPLPPYIKHKLQDRERYQTVYATHEGSAAAPTAGLHFTEELLAGAEHAGAVIARVTLHVGLGTFRPVKVERVEEHHMHSEAYTVSEEAAASINAAKEGGGRVICVGTTSCRTIESAAGPDGRVKAGNAETDIFIYPGYRFRVMDGLLTNFHLPGSTLLMLVSAFAGRENIIAAYNDAVRERYRFFSFGDAMLII